jgi:hypothetical protein
MRNPRPFRIPVLPVRLSPQSGFSRGRRNAERSAWSFRRSSGMRCRVDGHSRLPTETSASCCGQARKHQWMLEFLVALTLPATAAQSRCTTSSATTSAKRSRRANWRTCRCAAGRRSGRPAQRPGTCCRYRYRRRGHCMVGTTCAGTLSARAPARRRALGEAEELASDLRWATVRSCPGRPGRTRT